MLRGRKRYGILLAGFILCLSLFAMSHMDVQAVSRKEYLDSLNVGIAKLMDPSASPADDEAVQELTEVSQIPAGFRTINIPCYLLCVLKLANLKNFENYMLHLGPIRIKVS